MTTGVWHASKQEPRLLPPAGMHAVLQAKAGARCANVRLGRSLELYARLCGIRRRLDLRKDCRTLAYRRGVALAAGDRRNAALRDRLRQGEVRSKHVRWNAVSKHASEELGSNTGLWARRARGSAASLAVKGDGGAMEGRPSTASMSPQPKPQI
eukprot:353517-Chlamydomonas_euryale.AAC.12